MGLMGEKGRSNTCLKPSKLRSWQTGSGGSEGGRGLSWKFEVITGWMAARCDKKETSQEEKKSSEPHDFLK